MTREQEQYVSEQCNQFDGAAIEILPLTLVDDGPILVTLPNDVQLIVGEEGQAAALNSRIDVQFRDPR